MRPMPAGAPTLQIPRWIQLVGLPVLLVLLWVVAGAVRHVVFLFLVASLISLLLDPLVKAINRARIPRLDGDVFRFGTAMIEFLL